MPTVRFHASNEQLPPSRLVAAVKAAEAAGFQAAKCSDGVNALYLDHVGKEQDRFIEMFGEQVLPEVIE